jgi:hypothetical protein
VVSGEVKSDVVKGAQITSGGDTPTLCCIKDNVTTIPNDKTAYVGELEQGIYF